MMGKGRERGVWRACPFLRGRAGEESKKALVILYKYPKTKEGTRGHSPPPRRQAAAGRGFL